MSFEMFVQRFENGAPVAMATRAFREVWEPWTDQFEADVDVRRIEVPDGGQADVYARVAGETFDSLMISHFSPGEVLDLLFEFLVAADAVLMAPGCPTMLVRADQRCHLPVELRADVVVLGSVADVIRVLQEN